MSEQRKQREINFRRKLILDAAKAIFFDKGFENSTMEDIAHKAGYSKGSLYSYFKSKNEICFSIVNDYFFKIVDFIENIEKSDLTGLEKIVAVKEAFLRDYAENSEFCNIYDTFKYHRNQCSEIQAEIQVNELYSKKIKKLLVSIIQSGIEDRSIKKSVDVEKLATAFWNEKSCFIAEVMFRELNAYDYIFNLVIDAITEDV